MRAVLYSTRSFYHRVPQIDQRSLDAAAMAAALRERASGPTALRDRYAANLLASLIPGGYARAPPEEVRDRFFGLCEKLELFCDSDDPEEDPDVSN